MVIFVANAGDWSDDAQHIKEMWAHASFMMDTFKAYPCCFKFLNWCSYDSMGHKVILLKGNVRYEQLMPCKNPLMKRCVAKHTKCLKKWLLHCELLKNGASKILQDIITALGKKRVSTSRMFSLIELVRELKFCYPKSHSGLISSLCSQRSSANICIGGQ